ncbi:probable G-protein coupled receptor Mth-like 3 isoform X5 [Orussus abietinus]|uniref:probable G-protein coupled receptor Mth-like 3 isoform X5 n=1 Tax=Orussus abietinus TaxID=222816 RepID=UPI000C71621A|nr:probable G-protein coupled receptor Mth-like 3 isoform X5 [Orussus abietinus]
MIGRGLLGIFLALHLGSTRDPETGGLEEGRILRKDGGDGRFHRGLGSTTEKLETKEEIVPRNNRDENGETNICPSSSLPCVSFCCPPGHFLRDRKCNQDGNRSIPLPAVYEDDLRVSNLAFNEENFLFVVWDPCQGGERYPLYSHEYPEERFFLLKNGSVVTPFLKNAEVLLFAQYCLTRLPEVEEYLVLFCYHKVVGMEAEDPDDKPTFYPVGMIISVPFLVATFVIYAILPELRNLHGLTLRGYVGSLAVAYANLTVVQISSGNMPDSTCIALAFIIHFSFLASFFWLNVMCFDIWWTFGGFRSLQGSAKQREKKKFIMYSIYAWGCATLLTAVCMVMDLVPGIPKHYIRPEFGVGSCWYYRGVKSNRRLRVKTRCRPSVQNGVPLQPLLLPRDHVLMDGKRCRRSGCAENYPGRIVPYFAYEIGSSVCNYRGKRNNRPGQPLPINVEITAAKCIRRINRFDAISLVT